MSTDSGQTQTPRTFKQKILLWLWNLLNAMLGGVGTAGGAITFGAATGAATFTPRQIGVTVAAGALTAFFYYVRTNKLPDMFDGEA